MLFTQIVAYGVGGYVAGRLRTKWADVHGDEVYFRDTAHGFLVWALSAVVSAALLGSAIATLASGAAKAGASIASGAGAAVTASAAAGAGAAAGGMDGAGDYFTDVLLRNERPDAAGDHAAARAEVGRIVAMSLARGEMTPADRDYVARVIAAQAGIDAAAAQQRVNQTLQQARQAADDAKRKAREAADAARKAAAAFALWGFASMLIGAFVASLCATWGGRRRDMVDVYKRQVGSSVERVARMIHSSSLRGQSSSDTPRKVMRSNSRRSRASSTAGRRTSWTGLASWSKPQSLRITV